VQFGDRAAEFALQRPHVIGALHEIAQAELPLIENLKSNAVAAGQPLDASSMRRW